MDNHERCMELWRKRMAGELSSEEFTRQLNLPDSQGQELRPGVKKVSLKSNPDYFND